MGICKMTSLVNLTLDQNQLVALPDGCFSRLGALKMFSAYNNSITHLQVARRILKMIFLRSILNF